VINLNQLRAFYEMAKSLNFSAAAERLCVTQPAVSKQIKYLEEYYDLKLFIKKGRMIELTDEGTKIFVYAKHIFESERHLEEIIIGMKSLRHGSLCIGTTKTYARYFILPLLSLFQSIFPNIIVELDEGSSLDMSKTLLDFKNSLVIVAKVENDPGIKFIPLMVEEIVLIASPNYSLIKRGSVCFSDLKNIPIVMKETGSGTRKLIEKKFAEYNLKPNTIAQSSNMEFIKQMVIRNEAISFVVKRAVEDELRNGHLISVDIIDTKLLLKIFVAYLSEYELPKIAKNFVDFVISPSENKKLPVGMQEVLSRISGSVNELI